MMYIDLKVNETLKIGDVAIKLIDKSGRLARLAVDAQKSMPVSKQPPSEKRTGQ